MAPLRILIDNKQKKRISTDNIRQKTKQILSGLGCNAHELSVVITDDSEIHRLNKTYRGLDRPTNVLSFPMQEGQFSDINPGLLGDVVISCETAEKEADTAGITLPERISQLLVHGVLHLVGFDHETDSGRAEAMEKKSLEILRKIEPNRNLNAF